MKEFAYIGRDKPSKGLPHLIEFFNRLDSMELKLHVFSDFIGIETSNIVYHGWVESKDIWAFEFHYVILPMLAPETYCFSLHDAVKFGRGVIVNGGNESLCSQIMSDAHVYNTDEELESILHHASKDKTQVKVPKVKKKRTLWERGSNKIIY